MTFYFPNFSGEANREDNKFEYFFFFSFFGRGRLEGKGGEESERKRDEFPSVKTNKLESKIHNFPSFICQFSYFFLAAKQIVIQNFITVYINSNMIEM